MLTDAVGIVEGTEAVKAVPGVLHLVRTEEDLTDVCHDLLGVNAEAGQTVRRAGSQRGLFPREAVDLDAVRSAIHHGLDPLGEAFSRIRSPLERRATGAVYTPDALVRSMVDWLAMQGPFDRIVDPGAGSGRFILAAVERFPEAQLVAVEMDPLAALMLRANVHVRGWTARVRVLEEDYRRIELPAVRGATAFVGNPPYVRHHDIPEVWKAWYVRAFAGLDIRASALAGLHLHFFLKTRLLARHGDAGAFVTSSEWMDVNYGAALRRLLTDELGGIALHVLQPTIEAFPGTHTTAAITCFRVGESSLPVRVRAVDRVDRLDGLDQGTEVSRELLRAAPRWSVMIRPSSRSAPGGGELGEWFRVHRGQVTGANDIWIAGEQANCLPERVLVPTVTKARDLIVAGARLESTEALRRVVDLPPDLHGFTAEEQDRIHAFLTWARSRGADAGYVARHRKAWWSVGLRAPAPILCTYMARRAPQFTRNPFGARHINVAHGLYPRRDLDPQVLDALVRWLNQHVEAAQGRTYAGGLTKFEPREIERLRIPRLESLLA